MWQLQRIIPVRVTTHNKVNNNKRTNRMNSVIFDVLHHALSLSHLNFKYDLKSLKPGMILNVSNKRLENLLKRSSGVGRILVWDWGPHRGAEGAEGGAPSPENFWLFSLEMVHFDAHLRYSDVLVWKFCFATQSRIHVYEYKTKHKRHQLLA